MTPKTPKASYVLTSDTGRAGDRGQAMHLEPPDFDPLSHHSAQHPHAERASQLIQRALWRWVRTAGAGRATPAAAGGLRPVTRDLRAACATRPPSELVHGTDAHVALITARPHLWAANVPQYRIQHTPHAQIIVSTSTVIADVCTGVHLNIACAASMWKYALSILIHAPLVLGCVELAQQGHKHQTTNLLRLSGRLYAQWLRIPPCLFLILP